MIIREERIGGQRLILGDCLEVMPLLGKVGAVDNRNAVVFNRGYEEPAKRQHRTPARGDEIMGTAQARDSCALSERNEITGGNGRDVWDNPNGISEGDCANGHPTEITRQGRESERALHRRDAKHDLPQDGGENALQQMRGNGPATCASCGRGSHEQHGRELGGSLQSMPQQPPQAGMVEFPEGWAILTDPPYGIGADKGVGKYGRLKAGPQRWDSAAPDLSWVSEYPAIVWGGNYFGLPASRAYLVWDKGAGFKGRDFAECEMAWCSFDANARIFARDPLAKGDYRGKQHPTQKPVALMEYLIKTYTNVGETVLDFTMGSGTTGVACVNTGRAFIGIEMDADYFAAASKRISDHQPPLEPMI